MKGNVLARFFGVILAGFLSSCGGGGGSMSGGSSTVPAITSVSVSCSPNSISTAQTSQCTAAVLGTGAFSTAVTWTAIGGTITSGGVFTPSGAGTATITATSTQDSTKSGSASITVNQGTVISAVSVSCIPLSITTAQTSTCTATVTGTGSYSSVVTWTATGGTITSAGVFAPSGAGTAIITATSTQDTTKFGTASITVTALTVTGVALACTPTSITTDPSSTSQCMGTVTYSDGSTDHSVTYATSLGTITSAGLLASTSAGTATVTATSVQNSTKTATTSVTVTAAPITLSSITPGVQYCLGQCGFPQFTFNGTNFPPTYVDISCTPTTKVASYLIASSTQLTVQLAIDQTDEGSGYRSCQVCQSNGTGCSNAVPLGLY